MPYYDEGQRDSGAITVRRETFRSFRESARHLGLPYDTLLARLLEEGLPSVREGRAKEILTTEGGGE